MLPLLSRELAVVVDIDGVEDRAHLVRVRVRVRARVRVRVRVRHDTPCYTMLVLGAKSRVKPQIRRLKVKFYVLR